MATRQSFLTAAKLGDVVGVSESTVVRFATHLGYKGYPDFQKHWRNWYATNSIPYSEWRWRMGELVSLKY